MPVKIGYQGLEGSFSEAAAKEVAKDCGLKDVEYIPLETASAVIHNLHRGTIDYALVATRNSIGGNVEETMREIRDSQLQLKRAHVMPIHQCLFKQNPDVSNADITHIASHEQALRQTEQFRKKTFPLAETIEEKDTTRAAMKLSSGELDSSHCAVICSYEAGINHGLCLIQKNIEDKKDNETEFRLFRLPQADLVTEEAFDDAITRDSLVTEYLGKFAIIVVLALALWGLSYIDGTPLVKISTLTGYLLAVYVIYKRVRNSLSIRAIKGYWKYYSKPDNNVDERQQYHIPRVVEIRHTEDHFRLHIYTSMKGKGQISVIGEPGYVFETGRSRGKFTYEYRAMERDRVDVSGFVILNWYKKHPWSVINKMNGDYCGTKSKEIGSFTFYRISQEEFNDIQQSEFLTK